MMNELTTELKEVPKQEKKVLFSQETKDILERRGEALERGEEENYERLTKEFRKVRRRIEGKVSLKRFQKSWM